MVINYVKKFAFYITGSLCDICIIRKFFIKQKENYEWSNFWMWTAMTLKESLGEWIACNKVKIPKKKNQNKYGQFDGEWWSAVKEHTQWTSCVI